MKRAIKYIYDANPFFVHLKKHFCPRCKGKLKMQYVSKFINSQSPEAKEYDFSIGDTFLAGDVEFRIQCFHCAHCNLSISLREMKKHEKREKGQEGQGDG